MPRYEVLQIVSGIETVMLDTTVKKKAAALYRTCHAQQMNARLRIDGEMIPILQADKIIVLNMNAAASVKKNS